MKLQYVVGRFLHGLLVLALGFLIVRALYYGFSLLREDAQRENAVTQNLHDLGDLADDKPSPQMIVSLSHNNNTGGLIPVEAESLNTFWLSYDLDHCRNVCEASKIACRLRDCGHVPGVKSWD